ncbi:MAG: hypothetical protein AAGD01_13205 [Acidobacteriota bacterium]
MLDLARKFSVSSRIPEQALITTASLTAFGWLLANDLIHPVAIFFLQLYLTF